MIKLPWTFSNRVMIENGFKKVDSTTIYIRVIVYVRVMDWDGKREIGKETGDNKGNVNANWVSKWNDDHCGISWVHLFGMANVSHFIWFWCVINSVQHSVKVVCVDEGRIDKIMVPITVYFTLAKFAKSYSWKVYKSLSVESWNTCLQTLGVQISNSIDQLSVGDYLFPFPLALLPNQNHWIRSTK